MNKKRGQTFSFDAIIASIIFIVLIGAFLIFTSKTSDSQLKEDLNAEASVLMKKAVKSSDPGQESYFIENDKVDNEKLQELMAKDYEDLKKLYGSKYDFCLYFEDELGQLVDMDPDPAWIQYSIGSNRSNMTIFNTDGSYNRTVVCGTREPASS